MSQEQFIHRAVTICREAQADIAPNDSRLDKVVANSKAQGLPHIAISPAQGQYLSILCQFLNAKAVLEIGTLGGYSTTWFARSTPTVKVTSIEINEKHRSVALENLQGLDNVDIILGAALDVLPKLAAQGRVFDFVFIDATWEEQWEYFDWAIKLVRQGGCIFVDNAVRQLTESEADDPTGRILIEKLKTDTRVQASILPTLNLEKDKIDEIIDGYVIAIKK